MKKLRLTFLYLFIFSVGSIFSQTLQGVVLDKDTNEPLHNAVVYLDRTSFICATNTDGKFNLPVGNRIHTSLIISHVAYEKMIISDPFTELPDTVYLQETMNQLNVVTISAKKGKFTRKKMMKAFKQQFLGISVGGISCKILNEDDIILKYDEVNQILLASSNIPIEIVNKYLGYKIRWEFVESNICYKKVTLREDLIKFISIMGTASFEDLAPDNLKIQTRRNDAHKISARYFFSLIAKEKLDPQRFLLFSSDKEAEIYLAHELFTVKNDLYEENIKQIIINPKFLDDKGNITINIHQDISPSTEYPLIKSSSIFFLANKFDVDLYGNTNLGKNFALSGEMGFQRTGDILPLDYQPKDKFRW
jgi:hypothetical protein